MFAWGRCHSLSTTQVSLSLVAYLPTTFLKEYIQPEDCAVYLHTLMFFQTNQTFFFLENVFVTGLPKKIIIAVHATEVICVKNRLKNLYLLLTSDLVLLGTVPVKKGPIHEWIFFLV